MQEDNKKAITISFVAAAILVGFTAHLMLQFLAQSISFVARIESNEVYSNGLPVVFGLITFAVLQLNVRCVEFMDGVVNELMKVVWPSRKDTSLMTVVVVVCVVISGVIIGAYDSVWAFVINKIIK